MRTNLLYAMPFLACVIVAASCKQTKEADITAVIESDTWYTPRVKTEDKPALPINKAEVPDLDVRGVGDSAVNLSKLKDNPDYWNGDLAFINWESVVSDSCSQQNGGVDFFFKSSPSAINVAYQMGFNIFNLANNHARDCLSPYGPAITSSNMEILASQIPILWGGVAPSSQNNDTSQQYQARVRTFSIKEKELRVAFASIAIQSWHMSGVAEINTRSENPSKPLVLSLLKSLQQAEADFRILSIHTQDGSGNNRQEDTAFRYLKEVGETFIREFDGNVVFGHGPHTQAGVKIIQSAEERNGVFFTSLGNFMHPGLAAHSENYVGRAVFDWTSKNLKFVQTFPVARPYSPAASLNGHVMHKIPFLFLI